MALSNRAVAVVILFTAVFTIYSLSELHGLSVQHVQEDAHLAGTSKPGGQASSGGSLTTVKAPTTITLQQPQSTTQFTVKTTPVEGETFSNKDWAQKKCFTYEHTELWGDVVVWGTTLLLNSIGECCDACRKHKTKTDDELDCNVFVWCGDQVNCKQQYKQCWLKHLAHPEATKPARQGPDVPWTSGTINIDMNDNPRNRAKKEDPAARKFHTITSAQGSAVHWQMRVHYYWFQKQKALCEQEGNCHMGGFTRLLHSGVADDLMQEIPTVVVDPLPADMVEHNWYVVLNRPYAFVQWVKQAKIPERFVLMSEPDHIFLKPMPNYMTGDTPASFPFFYIEPAKPDHLKITQKFTGPVSRKQLEQIAPIGNSPTFMTFTDMAKTMPQWMNTSIAIFKDTEANQAWGWVQEMYGFTIAAWLVGVKKFDLFLELMSQPPWDTSLNYAPDKPFQILHYTYGCDYKLTGEFTPGKYGEWRFDKRSYGTKPIPRHLSEPPANMKNDLVRALINAFNEATEAIPCWDEYAVSGKVPATCTEPPRHFLAQKAAREARGP